MLDAHINLTKFPDGADKLSDAPPDQDETCGAPGQSGDALPQRCESPTLDSSEAATAPGEDAAGGQVAALQTGGDRGVAAPQDGSHARLVVAESDQADPPHGGHDVPAPTTDPGEVPSADGDGDLSEATVELDAQCDEVLEKEYGLRVHPVCAMFPPMTAKELLDLAGDIRTNGLVHPIITNDGQIIDGRHRLKACREAGVEPRFLKWSDAYTGTMSVARWIWSVNAERRHMADDQIGAAKYQLIKYEKWEAARKRQIAAGSQQGARGEEGGRGNKKPLAVNSPQGVLQRDPQATPAIKPGRDRSRDSRAEIARELDWTDHKAKNLIEIDKAEPQAVKEIILGTTTVKKAAKRVKASLRAKSASARKKAKPPVRNLKAAQPRAIFDMEPALKTAMSSVDEAFESVPADWRDDFKKELIKTIQCLP